LRQLGGLFGNLALLLRQLAERIVLLGTVGGAGFVVQLAHLVAQFALVAGELTGLVGLLLRRLSREVRRRVAAGGRRRHVRHLFREPFQRAGRLLLLLLRLVSIVALHRLLSLVHRLPRLFQRLLVLVRWQLRYLPVQVALLLSQLLQCLLLSLLALVAGLLRRLVVRLLHRVGKLALFLR